MNYEQQLSLAVSSMLSLFSDDTQILKNLIEMSLDHLHNPPKDWSKDDLEDVKILIEFLQLIFNLKRGEANLP